MPGGAGSVFTVEVGEDLLDDHRIIDAGDDLDAAAASPTGLDVDVEYPHQALRPGHRGTALRWGPLVGGNARFLNNG